MVCYFSPPPGGLAFADLFPAGVPDLEHDLDDLDLERCRVCDRSYGPNDGGTAWVMDRHTGSIDFENCCDHCYVECDYCEEYYSSDLVRRVNDGHMGSSRLMCYRCEDLLSECYWCSHYFDLDSDGATVGGDPVCSDCLDDRYIECVGCDSYARSDYTCDECGYCEDCGCSDGCDTITAANDRGDLLPYDYKPEPVFHGDGPLFLGFELEIETGNARRNRADYVRSISSGVERVYLKHDGSLLDGIEIVTHPMSPASLVEWWPKFSSALDELRAEGCTSWNGHRCGFHVHLSRSAFVSPRHLFTFALFVYRNAYDLQRISGRRSAELASYCRLDLHNGEGPYDRYGDGRLIDKVRNARRGGARHVAVNLTNSSTVEVRLFRGSLRAATLRGYLDLVVALYHYTLDLTVGDIHGGALTWAAFVEWLGGPSGSYPDLVALDRLRSTAGVS